MRKAHNEMLSFKKLANVSFLAERLHFYQNHLKTPFVVMCHTAANKLENISNQNLALLTAVLIHEKRP